MTADHRAKIVSGRARTHQLLGGENMNVRAMCRPSPKGEYAQSRRVHIPSRGVLLPAPRLMGGGKEWGLRAPHYVGPSVGKTREAGVMSFAVQFSLGR